MTDINNITIIILKYKDIFSNCPFKKYTNILFIIINNLELIHQIYRDTINKPIKEYKNNLYLLFNIEV